MSVNEDRDLVPAEKQDNAEGAPDEQTSARTDTDGQEEAGAEGSGEEPNLPETESGGGGTPAQPGGTGAGENEDDEEGEEQEGMTLLQHLEELRVRLTRAIIAVAVGFVASYAFSQQLFQFLMMPMENVLQGSHFQYTYPPEAFFTYIKISIVAGIFLASPYIFAQIWGFIAPGLYEHERKWFVPLVLVTAILFTAGALFGYFIVFPFGFDFFASFSTQEIHFVPKLSEYTSFCLKLLFAFGFAFELPVFIFFLARMGLATSKGLRKKRKYAILISFIISAALTPPDPFTQSLMAGPIILLYESGIWIAAIFGKKEPRNQESEEDEAEETDDAPESDDEAAKADEDADQKTP